MAACSAHGESDILSHRIAMCRRAMRQRAGNWRRKEVVVVEEEEAEEEEAEEEEAEEEEAEEEEAERRSSRPAVDLPRYGMTRRLHGVQGEVALGGCSRNQPNIGCKVAQKPSAVCRARLLGRGAGMMMRRPMLFLRDNEGLFGLLRRCGRAFEEADESTHSTTTRTGPNCRNLRNSKLEFS
jgi:hypothetical protein